MKNVLGQYTLAVTEADRGADETNSETEVSFNQTLTGLSETYRVLQAGGRLAIAEEDTPANHDVVTNRLREIGFVDVSCIPYSAVSFRGPEQYRRHNVLLNGCYPRPDRSWLEERTKYWSLLRAADKFSEIYGREEDERPGEEYQWSYLLTARRPHVPAEHRD